MIEFYKQRGETPLEALNRLKIERPELSNETMSYAGRLDPMAEGILPVLIGEEENKNRQAFLNKDKEYYVELLLGFQTDTGDVLGIVTEPLENINSVESVEETCKKLTSLTEQTYPWYSSKTVNGKPLFEYARNGNFDIERPVRAITIYKVDDVQSEKVKTNEIIENIIFDIKKVSGDFRQNEIIDGWTNQVVHTSIESYIISFRISVSSGTYIRALTEYIQSKTGIPNTVLKLVRTQIF